MGVDDVSAIDAEWVADQARCVLEDMPVAAFKIGLLASLEQIASIAEVVSDYPDVPPFTGPASRVTLPPAVRTRSHASFTSGTAIATWP